MSQEEFLLKWNDHHASFFTIVEDLCRTEQLCDVTLACGGQVFETHKLILSVCSPYFRTLLNSRPDKHPIVYLKDVNPKHLEQLLSYMYRGEINVLQDDLGPLIETARGLQIKVRDCEILPGLVWCPCSAGQSVVRIGSFGSTSGFLSCWSADQSVSGGARPVLRYGGSLII